MVSKLIMPGDDLLLSYEEIINRKFVNTAGGDDSTLSTVPDDMTSDYDDGEFYVQSEEFDQRKVAKLDLNHLLSRPKEVVEL